MILQNTDTVHDTIVEYMKTTQEGVRKLGQYIELRRYNKDENLPALPKSRNILYSFPRDGFQYAVSYRDFRLVEREHNVLLVGVTPSREGLLDQDTVIQKLSHKKPATSAVGLCEKHIIVKHEKVCTNATDAKIKARLCKYVNDKLLTYTQQFQDDTFEYCIFRTDHLNVVLDVPGDGRCFYYSVAVATSTTAEEVERFRERGLKLREQVGKLLSKTGRPDSFQPYEMREFQDQSIELPGFYRKCRGH